METLQIFISSPGDVAQDRALSQRIIESLQGRFMGYVKLKPIFWEHEPLMASSSFQDQIILPSQTDIVVCILWSRLERHMVRNRSPARTEIFVNKANSFGFSHSKAKGFNAVYGHFRLVLGNV
jgi:hypothetical protein